MMTPPHADPTPCGVSLQVVTEFRNMIASLQPSLAEGVQEHTFRAKAMLEGEDYAKAERECNRALEILPDLAEVQKNSSLRRRRGSRKNSTSTKPSDNNSDWVVLDDDSSSDVLLNGLLEAAALGLVLPALVAGPL